MVAGAVESEHAKFFAEDDQRDAHLRLGFSKSGNIALNVVYVVFHHAAAGSQCAGSQSSARREDRAHGYIRREPAFIGADAQGVALSQKHSNVVDTEPLEK